MKITKPTNRGFTLIELLVVITIIAILASSAMPAYNKITESAQISKTTSNVKQIMIGCRAFAADWDGIFPSFDPEESGAGNIETSTAAFNLLIPEYIDVESVFWTPGNPDKPRAPREDGELEEHEVSFSYVKGQTTTSFSRSPLVADQFDAEGGYGEYHPWLKSRKAVIGYCGGNVVVEKLTSDEPGATVKTKDGTTDDIFQKRDGESGGLLSVGTDNILHP